jgi:hypothetical protein
MILVLFGFLLALSFILVIIGLIKTEHTELSIIGFFFIFLLSFTLINNNLEYSTGENTTISYSYINNSLKIEPWTPNYIINTSKETKIYNYTNYGNHNIGYYLALASALGMSIVLYSLKNTRWKKEL